MIHNGDELETGVVRRAGHRGQVRAEPRGAVRGGEIGDLQANLHAPPPPERLSYPGPPPWPGDGPVHRFRCWRWHRLPGPRPARAGPVTASGHAEWGDERIRAE